MNSTLLRTIAILMAVGGVATAWLGYRMSTQPQKPALPTVQITYPQLVATRDLPAGQILAAGDVRLVSLPQRDPSALTGIQQAVGKMIMAPVAREMPLLASNFPIVNPVAQSLRPDERAVAIKVNEVIGVGGLIKPGDHVDVLLYLRKEPETGDVSSAQVVLGDVRVLAYGDETAQPSEQQDAKSDTPVSAVKQGVSRLESIKAREGKSAILAVPERDAARLMLAENSGILRLALRGANLAEAASVTDRHFVRLEAIGKGTQDSLAQAGSAPPAISRKTAASRASESQVIVHQGDRVEIVKVKP